MTESTVELDVQVFMLQQVPKRDPPGVYFTYGMPAPADRRDGREYDPNVVAVQLRYLQDNAEEFALNMLLTAEHAKKFGLIAGDNMKLKIIKEH